MTTISRLTIVIFILMLLTTAYSTGYMERTADRVKSIALRSLDIDGLKKYLTNVYIPSMKAVRASKTAEPYNHRVYLNDNILAVIALKALNLSIGYEIEKSINKILNTSLEDFSYIVLGRSVKDVVYCRKERYVYSINVEAIGRVEVYEKYLSKDCIVLEWSRYSERLFYKALNSVLLGDIDRAISIFEYAMNLWDGYGFRDRVYEEKGLYSLKSIALALYIYRLFNYIGIKGIDRYWNRILNMISIVSKTQNLDGGFPSVYKIVNGVVKPVNSSDTETTCLVIISLISDKPIEVAQKVHQSLVSVSQGLEFLATVSTSLIAIPITFAILIRRVGIEGLKKSFKTLCQYIKTVIKRMQCRFKK